MAETYKLTYFNMRAVAEPARLIFAYAGVPYEDHRIEHAVWPEHKKNYPWGKLPVLQVGDKVLTQSNAICRYLAKKFNLNGSNDWEQAQIDALADAMSDFRIEWSASFREKDEAKKAVMKKAIEETSAPAFYGNLEAVIAANGGSPYLVGKNLTWVDLLIAHYLEMFEKNSTPGGIEKFPNLKKLKETVFNIPQIKAWVEKRPESQF